MSLRVSCLLALAALVALPACGDAVDETASSTTGLAVTPSASTSTEVDPASLMGRAFVSTSSTRYDLVQPAAIHLSFAEGRLTMQAGCNTIFGTVAVEGGVLLVDEVGTTEIGCDEATATQDGALAGFIQSRPDITVDDDRLVLSTPQGTLTFTDREVTDPDRPLLGTLWTADTLLDADTASTLPLGATATLSIAEGIAAVHTGCNSGTAPVTIVDATLSFGPLTTTQIGCEGDAAELERIVVSMLSGDLTVAIDAGRLTLTHPDGTGLGFTVR
jgi:heat shock protein HslJ